MYWNKRLYYDATYGDIIQETGGFPSKLGRYSIEHEISIYPVLSERNRDTFDYIELEPGQYDEEFATGYLVRVNPETRMLEFIYQNPNNPDEEPVPQKPLTEQVAEIKEELATTKRMLSEKYAADQELLELLIDMGVF